MASSKRARRLRKRKRRRNGWFDRGKHKKAHGKPSFAGRSQ